MGVIGDTLSAARTRRGVDLEEVHAATGIRPRYLLAIEQEDWDALPEEFYARSFVRKYAQFLDLDPEALVEEYRRQRGGDERGGEAPASPFARTSSRRAEALRRRRKRQGVYAWVAAAAVVAAIVFVVVLIASGGGGGGSNEASGGAGAGANANAGGNGAQGGKGAGGGNGGAQQNGGGAGAGQGGNSKLAGSVALEIEPTAEVWTCVLDAAGKPLVDGLILAAGETMGPFHSRSYTAAFGNGSVHVLVDGVVAQTSVTPSPMGITVDSQGKVHELPEGERPSCE